MPASEGHLARRRLDGKHVVVTGAAGGIGSEVCRRVRRLGGTLTAIDVPDRADSPLWEELEAPFIGIDLAGGLDEAHAALAPIESLDGLVNVAAVGPKEVFPEYTDSAWDLIFDVNLRAPMHMTQALFPRFQPGTAIVNFLSLEGLSVVNTSGKTAAAYAASKGALATFTRTLAVDLGRAGHRVNAVAPGLIATAQTAAISDASRQWVIGQTPLGRVGEPIDVAKVVGFLLSSASRFMTGEEITIDGGFGMWLGR
ncbi:MAG TPA: SDR family oxidoreductase [Solirubrobacterales bacterium]|nr:SDR family oxidoreductase [Solirubrobacterales bacterium]